LTDAIASHETIKELMAAEPQMYCMYHNGLERIYAMKD